MAFGRLAGAEIAQNLGKPQGEVDGQSIQQEVESKRSDSVMLMEKDLLIGEGRRELGA
jgi:succinate dehydrogenase/fumarate reductase flavoprotein subunit